MRYLPCQLDYQHDQEYIMEPGPGKLPHDPIPKMSTKKPCLSRLCWHSHIPESNQPAPGHGQGPMMSHAVPCGVSSCHVPICAKRLVWSWRWCLGASKGIFQVGNTKESDVALRRLVKHFGEVINSMFTRHTASRDNYCWSMMPIVPTWFSPRKSPLRRRLQTLKFRSRLV